MSVKNLNHENENMERKILKTYLKNHFLNVKNSLLELET